MFSDAFDRINKHPAISHSHLRIGKTLRALPELYLMMHVFFFLSCSLKERIGFFQFPNRRAQPLSMLLIGGGGTGLPGSASNLQSVGFFTHR
ncbi:hypothetical protein [Arthrobacter sp. CAN_A1]|uniref:hypothetical protein n=1 Tax=Arthrobacter sp. CAN_A1 TaxID=2787717 RepID=UPI0018CAC4E3